MIEGKFEDIVAKDDGFLRGPFGSALKKSLFVPKSEETYKVYEQSVVLEKNSNIGRYYISKEYYENNMSRFSVKPGDFLVSCSGVNYGAIYQLPDKIEPGVINQALLRIRLNKNIVDENYFLYYFRAYIANVITGGTGDSTIPNFPPMSVVKSVKIKLPKMEIQKKVGAFLRDIENKIDNNNKIIEELEQMVKTMYDYWFLQFEFPNEERKPYKSSGGKMVWNDEMNRKIPEGWEVTTIGEIIIEKEKSKIQVGQAKNQFGKYPFFTSGSEIYETNEFLTQGRNCYLSTGGKGNIKYHIGKASYSTDTWVITSINNLEDYLYLFIKSIENILDKKYFAGTGLKHLQKELFKNTNIIIPNNKILEKFNAISNPKFEKISKVYGENKELMKLRDFLLPLLMNGQVSV